MNTALHFSSERQDWATPRAFFQKLDALFHFTLDVCATAENTTCGRFFGPEDDGLKQKWAPHSCFCNPPYSSVGDWMHKAAEEARDGARVVCLVPARVDTRWFRSAFDAALDLILVQGRLKFGDGKSSAPFPSSVFVFDPLAIPGKCGVSYMRAK